MYHTLHVSTYLGYLGWTYADFIVPSAKSNRFKKQEN